MLRSGELVGRKLGARFWVADLNSVHDRRRRQTPSGRPWSARTARAIITALSDGSDVDARTARLIIDTSTNDLWRRVSQLVEIRTYDSLLPEQALAHLAPTGANALERLGERLVGPSRVVEGYLRGIDLDVLVDVAGLVPDSEGRIAVHRAAFATAEGGAAEEVPIALVAVDCARSPVSRVNRVGIRELGRLREQWLLQHT